MHSLLRVIKLKIKIYFFFLKKESLFINSVEDLFLVESVWTESHNFSQIGYPSSVSIKSWKNLEKFKKRLNAGHL